MAEAERLVHDDRFDEAEQTILDQYDSGRAENRAQLVRILGYDPTE